MADSTPAAAPSLTFVATVASTGEYNAQDYTAPKNADGSWPQAEAQSVSITLAADGQPNSAFVSAKGAGVGNISLVGLRGQPLQTDKKYLVTFTEYEG